MPVAGCSGERSAEVPVAGCRGAGSTVWGFLRVRGMAHRQERGAADEAEEDAVMAHY